MTNIVMLVCNRYRLTEQAFNSLFNNTAQNEFNLTIVDDGSTDFRMDRLLHGYACRGNVAWLRIEQSDHVLARAKNLGVFWSEQTFGRGDWLYLSDNDIWASQGWLHRMIRVFESLPTCPHVVGGNQHPFHKTNRDWDIFHETDAVAGYSMLMHWATWDSYGPLRGSAPGVGQSEDFDFSRRVVEHGGLVGYVHPPAIAHCGLTNTMGEKATGADQIIRVPGVLYE